MKMYFYCVIFFLYGNLIPKVLSEISNSNQDSYINALENSHQTTSTKNNGGSSITATDRDGFQPSPYDYQPPADLQTNYGPPLELQTNYGPPIEPHSNYGPPAPVYGPPKPIYGPPPFLIHHSPAYYHPRDEHWFFDKFKFKLDLFTVGKILLKLIIFKKIVKFIGLICLLLFLPKLKNIVSMADDDSGSMEVRSYNDKDNLNERINEITDFALTAIKTFSSKQTECGRDQIWCRFQRVLNNVDQKYSYNKIIKLYIPNANNIDTITE